MIKRFVQNQIFFKFVFYLQLQKRKLFSGLLNKQASCMNLLQSTKRNRHMRNMMDIHPIYSPRTSYKQIKTNDDKMIADMTLNFDKLTIQLLKQQFIAKNNELNLQQFIIIAKKHLKFWQVDTPNRDISLVRYLTYLFNQIDINGNGDMQWQQFTNYVIQKATVLKNLKSKADQVKHYVKSDLAIKIKIDTTIQKMEYITQIDRIAYFEQGSNKVNFFSLTTGQAHPKPLILDAKNLVVNISSVKKDKNGKVSIRKKDLVLPTNIRILDMIYISDKKYKVLVISTSDGIVRGWKYHQGGFIRATQPDNQQQLFQHSFTSEIYCLAWDGLNQILYCGQKNGNIYMWNLKTDLQKPLYQREVACSANQNLRQTNKNNGQSAQQKINYMITCMITMPKLQFMASGRMDGKLILWDTINNKKKWVYKQHTRGILTLAFNQTMILLFSAGFDHKICIWNPYISTLIHKIQGHLSPILSLKVIDNTHQLISMDSQGIVKITDTKRFHIIYSFSVDTTNDMGQQTNKKGNNLSTVVNSLIAISSPSLKLIFAGRTLSIYQYDKNYNPQSADEHTVICCRYVKSLISFFTPAGNKIKVWSALNGDVQKIYMDITPNQISTFDFDYLQKRMIIGDTKGNITMHNTVNGAKMKNLCKHNGQVTQLISTQNESNIDIFISCGVDNQIKIAKETQESFQIIRTIYLRKDISVSSLKYIEEIRLIVVGTNVGSIVFYDVQTGKNSGSVTSKPYEDITSLCKTSQPILFATTSQGVIMIVGLPPLPTRYQKIVTFQHFDEQKQNSQLGIRCSCYSKQQKSIFVVDDKMYLTCYSFQRVLQEMQHTDYNKQKTQSERRQVIYKLFDAQHNNYPIITKKWSVKAHSEVIKSVEYIQNQNLVITCSFDKKVKIWNSKTGEYIDSLQQNYSKKQPEPVAYLDAKNNILYSNDKKKAISNLKIDMRKMQFNPFYIADILQYEKNFTKTVSNKDWNMKINFKQQALQEIRVFQQLTKKLNQIQKGKDKQNVSQQIQSKLKQLQKGLVQKRELLKQINKQNNLNSNSGGDGLFGQYSSPYLRNEVRRNSSMTSNQSNIKKISTNYFKRSMMKCIQNFIDKNENNQLIMTLKEQTQKNKKKRTDFVPIYKMIHSNDQSEDQIKKHNIYIEQLARKQTQNIINSRRDQKVVLDKDQADKARKLCRLLINTDRKDQRPKILMRSIQIRQGSGRKYPLSHRDLQLSIKGQQKTLPKID